MIRRGGVDIGSHEENGTQIIDVLQHIGMSVGIPNFLSTRDLSRKIIFGEGVGLG